MRRVSLSDPPFEHDPEDPEGFRAGMLRPGPKLGASESGATLYELPPGQAICPYHYEYGEEEWVMALEGRPTIRTPEGTETIEPFDVVLFPRGPAGAPQIRNDTPGPVRVMMWSDVGHPAATVYPDSDKVGVWTGNKDDDVMVPRSAKVDSSHGET